MYAIVKTGGKQYKVMPGDKLNIEKLDAEVGDTVDLPVICIVDGENVEADPARACETKVSATVLEQFKGEKQIVFKFKRRKNYKRLRGHRQLLTRVRIDSVGDEVFEESAPADEVEDAAAEEVVETADEAKVAEAVDAEEADIEDVAEDVEDAAEDVAEDVEEDIEDAADEAEDVEDADEADDTADEERSEE